MATQIEAFTGVRRVTVIVALCSLGLLALGIWTGTSIGDASDTNGAVRDAAATAAAAELEYGDAPIAIVNGEVIPRRQIEAIRAFSFVHASPDGLDFQDDDAVIDVLVDVVLLSQEAERRGIAPGRERTIVELKRLSADIAVMRSSDQTPEELRVFIEAMFDNGLYSDDLSTNPELVDAFERNLAAAAVRLAVRETVGEGGGSEEDAEAETDALLAGLRVSATIERY